MPIEPAPCLFTRFISQPRWQLLCAVLTGVLLVLCFPPFDIPWIASIAVMPLLIVVSHEITWRRALGLGWLSGLIFFYFATNWVTHSMTKYGQMAFVLAHAVALLFAAILALFPALFAVVISQLVRIFSWRAIVLAPFVWVMSEWLRAIITGVTWNALGVSQINFLPNGTAQLGGAYLLSFVAISIGTLALFLLRGFVSQQRWKLSLTASPAIPGMLVILLLFVAVPASYGPENSLSVVGIQPDIPLNFYDDSDLFEKTFQNNIRLTREAIERSAEKRTDLIVWAESPLILNYEENDSVRAMLDKLAGEFKCHVIFNAVSHNGGNYFNSVQTLAPPSTRQPARALTRYDKMRLVPFGEYVPFRSVLGRFVPAITGDFTPGLQAVVNNLRLSTQLAIVSNHETEGETGIERTTNFARVGTFICYEAAYPNLVRSFVQRGATLLVNVSNDAWFGNSAGARQHLMHARMRAIENNRDIVRVTNSGISALITAEGRVVNELPQFTAASQMWTAHTHSQQTFYTHHGDWAAVLSTMVTVMALLIGFYRHRFLSR